jgi:peptidoglycan/LPS O-acetylase OafA/YrhL
MVLTVLLTIAYTIAVVLTVSNHAYSTAWIYWLIVCNAVGLAGAIGACLGLRQGEDAIQRGSIREVENALMGLEENAQKLGGLANN